MKTFQIRHTLPIYTLFVLSGFCALVYETVWLRYFAFYCGNTTFASTSIFTAFMAGLGIGSYLIGKRVDVSPHPLRVYAALELAIGVYALLLPEFIRQFKPYFGFLTTHLENHFLPLNIARFCLVFVLLIFPTSMMGGTLPALVKALGGERGQTARRLALLYALNTLGGAAGTAAAGFHFLGTIGLESTQHWVVFANLIIAAAAYLLSRYGDYSSAGIAPHALHAESRPPDNFLLVCFGLAGFAALAYEVVCLRLLLFLLPYGYNNVYVFSTVLSVFLFGIFAGSAAIGLRIERIRNPLRTLAIIQIVLGLATAASLPVLSMLLRLESTREIPEFTTRALYSFLYSFVVLFPPTALMGMSLPLYGRLGLANYARLGTDVGRIYAANTMGNIAGAFLGGFALIPLFGIQKSFALVALVYLLVGVVMAGASESPIKQRRYRTFILTVGAGAAAVMFVLPFQRLVKPEPPYKLIHYSEGVSSTLLVLENESERVLQINDFAAAGTSYEALRNQRMMAYLPLIMHKDPKKVLVICLGTGTTAGAIAVCPGVENVTIVEIDEQVPKALGFFGKANFRLDLMTRKTQVVIEDGRAYTEFTRDHFDIITGEPLHPKRAGTINLYTREYYENGLARLNPGGIFAQWIPYHALTIDELLAILRTFADVFPHCYLWMGEQLIMLGTQDPILPDYNALLARMNVPEIRMGMRQVDFDDPLSILSGFLLWDDSFRAFSMEGRSLVDDLPHLEFSRDIMTHDVLRPLFTRRQSYLPYVTGLDHANPAVMAAYQSHAKTDLAITDMLDEKYADALATFRECESLTPGNPRLVRWIQVATRIVTEQKKKSEKHPTPVKIMPDRAEE